MPIGTFISEYEGKVVDNKDPNKNGKIRVSCPEIYGNVTVSDWIPSSENHSGQLMVPEIGDLVGIRCKDGDPNQLRYTSVKHIDGQTPSSAKSEIDFGDKGTSSFDSSSEGTVTEPTAPARSDYPGVKTIMENEIAFVELDDNGRFQYFNKTTKHFMEWHPDGTLVIKAKRIYIETSDTTEGIALVSKGRFDISVAKDLGISAFEDFTVWVKEQFIQTMSGSFSMICKKIATIGAGGGVNIDSEARMNITTRDQMMLLGKKIDIMNADDRMDP